MKKLEVLLLVLAIVGIFATAGAIHAGDLDQTEAPAPTMKTLNEIPPTWSQKLPAADRFELVLGGKAVLDKETGLVWEQAPEANQAVWVSACSNCQNKEVSNRKGWRLPTVEELASLVDNGNSNPSLPDGHPFSNVQYTSYWTSTTNAANPNVVRAVQFTDGFIGNLDKTNTTYFWCVRGGHGHDAY
jgi:hypothetical protein